jgi:hypothetical protein
MYFREGTITNLKAHFEPIRLRQPTDTIEKCIQEKVIPALITAREEFEDVDLIMPWRTPFKVTRTEHGHLRPWYLKHPETEEEIRVTCERIDYHGHTRLPYFMTMQRYIVGRPNLLNIPVVPINQDKSMHWAAGCIFHYLIKDVWVWSFMDTYPARIEVDCSFLSPNLSIKVGDVEKMLPYGMYLH